MDVAIVTGAAEGIGLAVAERLSARGLRVVIADVQERAGEAAAAACGGIFQRCDVQSEFDWTALGARAAGLGRLAVLVNNAGINPGPQDLASHELARWRELFAVNLDGTFLGCRLALNAMPPGGVIVNVASAAARLTTPDMAAYSASKAAVLSLTRAVALYAGRKGLGIRCNAVLPGSVETPMVDRLRGLGGDPDAARRAAAARHPIGFVGEPGDIAGMVSWLVSKEARFVTGAEFAVDGGLTL